MTRMGKARYAMAAMVIATVLWFIAHDTVPVTPMPLPIPLFPAPITENMMLVDLVRCETANFCIFNIKGEEGILGRNVAVYIQGFEAPKVKTAWCRVEAYRGVAARNALVARLLKGKVLAVVRAFKRPGSPLIEGKLLVDGEDVADYLIGLGVVIPVGIKVDWCVEPPREMEI